MQWFQRCVTYNFAWRCSIVRPASRFSTSLTVLSRGGLSGLSELLANPVVKAPDGGDLVQDSKPLQFGFLLKAKHFERPFRNWHTFTEAADLHSHLAYSPRSFLNWHIEIPNLNPHRACSSRIIILRQNNVCSIVKNVIAVSSFIRPCDTRSMVKHCMAGSNLLRPHHVFGIVKNCSARISFLRPDNVCSIVGNCMIENSLLRSFDICSMVKQCMAVSNLLRPHDVPRIVQKMSDSNQLTASKQCVHYGDKLCDCTQPPASIL